MTTRNCLAMIIPARWRRGQWLGARWDRRFRLSNWQAKAPAPLSNWQAKAPAPLKVLGQLLLAFAAVSAGLAAVPASPAAKPPAKRAAPRPASKAGELASLVRDWRETPNSARRALVESYAVAHAKDNSGTLARFALGMGEVEQRNFAAAVADLKRVQNKLPQIVDYTAYYLALARVESNDFNGVNKDLLPAHSTEIRSPLSAKSWLVEARALQATDAANAVRLLREHYSDLPQPDGDVTLADCYQAAQDLPHAADFYQRVYYQYVSGDAANRAAAALLTLKDTMGAAYPQPLPEQLLRRADRLLEIREYAHAKAEYQILVDQLTGPTRDQARVGVGAADFLDGKTAPACSYLRGLDLRGVRGGRPARVLSGRVRAPIFGRSRDDDRRLSSGQAISQVPVAFKGHACRIQSLPGDKPAGRLPAALQGRVRGFSERSVGGHLPLEDGLPGLPARQAGRSRPAPRASAELPGARYYRSRAVLPGAAL